MDDDAARGFLFSYEKLFGAKERSKTDLEHERQNTDSSLDCTRRLLYVACSRAEQSLALVAYTSDPQKVRTPEAAVKESAPETAFNSHALFRSSRRAVRRKCNVWETIPDDLLEKDEEA